MQCLLECYFLLVLIEFEFHCHCHCSFSLIFIFCIVLNLIAALCCNTITFLFDCREPFFAWQHSYWKYSIWIGWTYKPWYVFLFGFGRENDLSATHWHCLCLQNLTCSSNSSSSCFGFALITALICNHFPNVLQNNSYWMVTILLVASHLNLVDSQTSVSVPHWQI